MFDYQLCIRVADDSEPSMENSNVCASQLLSRLSGIIQISLIQIREVFEVTMISKPAVTSFPSTRATLGENRNATVVVVSVFDLVEHLVGQSICELWIPVWVLVLAGAPHHVGHGARVVVTITQEF